MTLKTFYTASEARKNLYQLIRQAAKGLMKPEIYLQGTDQPVIMMSKEEFESLVETVTPTPSERQALQEGQKTNEVIPHETVLEELGLKSKKWNSGIDRKPPNSSKSSLPEKNEKSSIKLKRFATPPIEANH